MSALSMAGLAESAIKATAHNVAASDMSLDVADRFPMALRLGC
jgi:hypothetical protein